MAAGGDVVIGAPTDVGGTMDDDIADVDELAGLVAVGVAMEQAVSAPIVSNVSQDRTLGLHRALEVDFAIGLSLIHETNTMEETWLWVTHQR